MKRTCANGTRQVRGDAVFTSECSTFTIDKLGGSGGSRIRDDDPIALRSSNGRYLSGIPTAQYDHRLWNYSTYAGPWQRFHVMMAQGTRWTDR